jgi:hypothetical protein
VTLPRCSKCHEVSVLDPCRDCATPEQLATYPVLPEPYAEMSRQRSEERKRKRRERGADQ